MSDRNENKTSSRTEVVKSYVSPQTLNDLDREADRRDMSRSALVDLYIRRGLRQDREDDVAAETRAVTELQDVIDRGLDDFRNTARHIQDLNAKSGVYAVAAFELLKQNYGEAQIREALQTGSRRLRDDDLAPDEESSDQEDDHSAGFWDE